MSHCIPIPEKYLTRQVPKLGLTREEVVFSFGSEQLVKQLRKINKLHCKKAGTTTLYDSDHVAEVWQQWYAGHFDHLLA